jgi:Ca-activated chloride channel homolog
MRRPGLVLAALLVAFATRPGTQFSSAVDLVEVYVTVQDRAGLPVDGLRADDFAVSEDGRPQAIQAFAAGDFPLSVALAIDHSSSMAGRRLSAAASAARSFLEQLRPSDQAMVVGISSDVEVIAPLSSDRGAQASALTRLAPWGATSLNDAIVSALDAIRPARGRRGLIVLSDGEDRYSEATDETVLEHGRRAGVLVYPVGLGRKMPALFPRLAVLSGGRSFQADELRRLPQVLTDIARELRHQYLLGFAPARPQEPGPPAWHTIQVRVHRTGVRVRARDGYYGN